jgi:NADPH:quinone reductase-like Zn-dependent oxidoreductase
MKLCLAMRGLPLPSVTDLVKHRAMLIPSDGVQRRQKVLITGAAGGVGIYLVQLASIAGLHVVAVTSSNTRNETCLRGLGADETVEYAAMKRQSDSYDVIIDTVGGHVLENCWSLVTETGTITSVDNSAFNMWTSTENAAYTRVKRRPRRCSSLCRRTLQH